MTTHSLLLLPGDGIGPEVMAEVERLVAFFNKKGKAQFKTETGAGRRRRHRQARRAARPTRRWPRRRQADAIVFGAVGGPKWDKVAYEIRPEAGLLRLRKELDLFANLRPAICYPALAEASSLRREHVEGLDILILRELTGGTYFGEPKEIVTLENGQKRAVDTTVYTTQRDRAHRPRRLRPRPQAQQQGALGREAQRHEDRRAVERGGHRHARASEAKDVELQHILADACAMQLVRNPKQFDVIVCDNLFGDMLSDEAAMLTGSIGMLPSASLGAPDAKTGKRKALYEPVHGSAPDIAGKGLANPIAAIASYGMALRYSYGLVKEADLIDKAIAGTLARGLRTADIMQPNMRKVGTSEMGTRHPRGNGKAGRRETASPRASGRACPSIPRPHAASPKRIAGATYKTAEALRRAPSMKPMPRKDEVRALLDRLPDSRRRWRTSSTTSTWS